MNESSHPFSRAKLCIPGGVNSPVRAFNGVGGDPVFIKHANSAYLYDLEDKRYIDYVGSWGPMIVGHQHPKVVSAIKKAVDHGISYGAPTEIETQLAEKICALIPSIDSVRMVNSGTEATMSAIRLARAYTKRDFILKFEGCYHGHADSFLVKAGSGALTLGTPSSPGVPNAVSELTLTATYNDIDSVQRIMADHKNSIAAIIVEPVAGNMNCIPPQDGFLAGLRSLCDEHQSLLIFDEVMSGFRVASGGAQSLYNIQPDITTLGKIIGGGMPVGAYGGSKQLMEMIAPAGPVYQAGTLSGNPLAMHAGLASLNLTEEPGFYQQLEQTTSNLLQGLQESARIHGIDFLTHQVGSMFGLFFSASPTVDRFSDVMACNINQFRDFFHLMLNSGIYLAPSAYEAGFVSSAHTTDDIDQTIEAGNRAFKRLA